MERSEALDKLYQLAKETQRGSTFAAFDELIQAVEQAAWGEADSHDYMMTSLAKAFELLQSQVKEG